MYGGVLDVDGKNFYSGRKKEISFWGTVIFIQLMYQFFLSVLCSNGFNIFFFINK